ncbi:GDSL-type esterase/lipase family protein [Rhodanobacter sp. Col0626]|uniref:GDSL-type esterase/lipase family protein n=1 Tax=Rhodanobacter sp. Col0626 TaxID=3415679 RepID=UPI003CEA7CCF
MNLFKTVASTLLLCLALPAGAFAMTPARPVLLLGDSLSSAHRIPTESGWVHLLDRRLKATDPSAPALVNASRAGKTLADGIAELPTLLARYHPQAVILELGGNDAYLGASDAQLRQNLDRLIDTARKAGARVAVLGFELPPKLDHDHCGSRLRAVYAQVAQDRHVVFLPSLMAGISDKPALLLDDGVHPAVAAQHQIVDNVWSTLRPFVLD